MQAFLIAMTIFGCDDGLSQCSFLDMVETRYPTVEACDSQLEKTLSAYDQSGYPTVIAVCREPGELVNVALGRNPAQPVAPFQAEPSQTARAPLSAGNTQQNALMRLTGRSFQALMGIFPSRQQVGGVLQMPVHAVTGSYAWLVRQVDL